MLRLPLRVSRNPLYVAPVLRRQSPCVVVGLPATLADCSALSELSIETCDKLQADQVVNVLINMDKLAENGWGGLKAHAKIKEPLTAAKESRDIRAGAVLVNGSGRKKAFVKMIVKESVIEAADMGLDVKTYLTIKSAVDAAFPVWYLPAYQTVLLVSLAVSLFVFIFRVYLLTQLKHNGGRYREKEVELYLTILTCLLFLFEDAPMMALNGILLSHARSFDTVTAVASFAFSVFQLGRRSSTFGTVRALYKDLKAAHLKDKIGGQSRGVGTLVYVVVKVLTWMHCALGVGPFALLAKCVDKTIDFFMNDSVGSVGVGKDGDGGDVDKSMGSPPEQNQKHGVVDGDVVESEAKKVLV